MLSRVNRLAKTKDIERVFKSGVSFQKDCLVLRAAKNDLGKIRLVFIVSKKVSKKASQRNLFKRRLSEIVRQKLPKLKKSFDIILLAKPGPETPNSAELEKSVGSLFSKAKLFI